MYVNAQIWELSWGREGFKGCTKVMDLKGHSSQVRQLWIVFECGFHNLLYNIADTYGTIVSFVAYDHAIN